MNDGRQVTDAEVSNASGPMVRARRIVEDHIRDYGYVPHPDKLKEAIATDLGFVQLAAIPHRDNVARAPVAADGEVERSVRRLSYFAEGRGQLTGEDVRDAVALIRRLQAERDELQHYVGEQSELFDEIKLRLTNDRDALAAQLARAAPQVGEVAEILKQHVRAFLDVESRHGDRDVIRGARISDRSLDEAAKALLSRFALPSAAPAVGEWQMAVRSVLTDVLSEFEEELTRQQRDLIVDQTMRKSHACDGKHNEQGSQG